MKKTFFIAVSLIFSFYSFCQSDTSDVEAVRRMVNLTEVVVRSDLNVPKFLQHIKNDTTFYKAFKNLRVLGFTSMNDIRMTDKNNDIVATLQSKTRQNRENGCRTMDVLEEKTTGKIYDKRNDWNYYTAELYAGLFFTQGKVCGETNIIKGIERNVQNKRGLDKQFVDNCFTLCPRQALHAKTLGFLHPSTGKEMNFDSELPEDMKALITKWRNYVQGSKMSEA